MLNFKKGTIKCLGCNKNFKRKMERKRSAFICSGFANYGKEFCVYYPIFEDDLILTISKHYSVLGRHLEGEIKDVVDRIEVKPEKGYVIYYVDGSTPSIIDNSEEYGIKVKF